MQPGEAADLAIFIVCTCLLAGYILFYFYVPSFTVPLLRRRYVNLISLNRTSRGEWVELLSRDPKEGINAVQTIRNQVISVSILAAAIVPLASTLINVLTDDGKIATINKYAGVDPISDDMLLSAPVKLGICLAILFLAIMALAQSCRLGVHIGYLVRVVASDPPAHKALGSHLVPIMQRSSLYFAIGLRLLFVFPPFLLYLIGPTTLLIATVVDLAAQLMFDVVVEPAVEPAEEEKTECDGTLVTN
ncbi:hypothetical protein C2E21_4037 [Chlorella sorokiniana]|uniref:Uncharacterized protein n=1 Tax=Chlorella sorokiniana TaxID=3076 RepID=A0A2P6TTS2_CHLSO|nr:hypothetical protein C2E21_4037 [Chlorella sorokiniana]|eukprot:PRW57444.1 hypothetical protein C2E21_4037 [Chlorella sorokiniana]